MDSKEFGTEANVEYFCSLLHSGLANSQESALHWLARQAPQVSGCVRMGGWVWGGAAGGCRYPERTHAAEPCRAAASFATSCGGWWRGLESKVHVDSVVVVGSVDSQAPW